MRRRKSLFRVVSDFSNGFVASVIIFNAFCLRFFLLGIKKELMVFWGVSGILRAGISPKVRVHSSKIKYYIIRW